MRSDVQCQGGILPVGPGSDPARASGVKINSYPIHRPIEELSRNCKKLIELAFIASAVCVYATKRGDPGDRASDCTAGEEPQRRP